MKKSEEEIKEEKRQRFLKSALFPLGIILLLCVSFASATFVDPRDSSRECSIDPADYHYANTTPNDWTPEEDYDVVDIPSASGVTYVVHLLDVWFDDGDLSVSISALDNGANLQSLIRSNAVVTNNWYVYDGSYHNTGYSFFHSTEYNITFYNDLSTNSVNYTTQPGGNNDTEDFTTDNGDFSAVRLHGHSGGTGTSYNSAIYVWICNQTGIESCNCPAGAVADTTPPEVTTSTLNHTTGRDAPNQTAWADISKLTMSETTDDTITITFTATETSNFSIGNSDKNITDMVPNFGNPCATTDTTTHSCTVNSTFTASFGSQCFYLSGRDTSGNENETSTSGCLNVSLIDLTDPSFSGAVNTSINFFRHYSNFTANITLLDPLS
ncbi:unnamed protein product, partial [marine sediment metagenome]